MVILSLCWIACVFVSAAAVQESGQNHVPNTIAQNGPAPLQGQPGQNQGSGSENNQGSAGGALSLSGSAKTSGDTAMPSHGQERQPDGRNVTPMPPGTGSSDAGDRTGHGPFGTGNETRAGFPIETDNMTFRHSHLLFDEANRTMTGPDPLEGKVTTPPPEHPAGNLTGLQPQAKPENADPAVINVQPDQSRGTGTTASGGTDRMAGTGDVESTIRSFLSWLNTQAVK